MLSLPSGYSCHQTFHDQVDHFIQRFVFQASLIVRMITHGMTVEEFKYFLFSNNINNHLIFLIFFSNSFYMEIIIFKLKVIMAGLDPQVEPLTCHSLFTWRSLFGRKC